MAVGVDVHNHFIPKTALNIHNSEFNVHVDYNKADKSAHMWLNGKFMAGAFEDPRQLFDPSRRIEDMDRSGIRYQALSVNPNTFFYSMDAFASQKFARIQNEGIARTIDAFPERFVGMGTLPLAYPKRAVKELRYCVEDLHLKGVEIGSCIRGMDLDDRRLWGFYDVAQELGIPIFIHPHKGKNTTPAEDRLSKFYLGNSIGNLLETALAVGHIIFGGVLEEYPDLTFVLAHAGGTSPYQFSRFDHSFKVRSEARAVIDRLPSEYFRKLYFDTITHNPVTLEYLLKVAGPSHILIGTDYPFDMGDLDPISTINKMQNVPDETREKIIHENAESLYHL